MTFYEEIQMKLFGFEAKKKNICPFYSAVPIFHSCTLTKDAYLIHNPYGICSNTLFGDFCFSYISFFKQK